MSRSLSSHNSCQLVFYILLFLNEIIVCLSQMICCVYFFSALLQSVVFPSVYRQLFKIPFKFLFSNIHYVAYMQVLILPISVELQILCDPCTL